MFSRLFAFPFVERSTHKRMITVATATMAQGIVRKFKMAMVWEVRSGKILSTHFL